MTGGSAPPAKIGAFAGAAILPALVDSWGLESMVLVPAGLAVLGALFTLMLPEPSGSTLEEISEQPADEREPPAARQPIAQGF